MHKKIERAITKGFKSQLSFDFRNRIHIKNYFNNFEKDESNTFSESRVQKTIKAMVWFFGYFQTYYPRPWPTA